MAVYDFFLSRNNGLTSNNYIGHSGRLFYDPTERVLRISDGSTPGGEIFNGYVSVTTTEPTQNFQGQLWLNPDTFDLQIYHNGSFLPTIDAATTTKLGGIKAGPGANVSVDGTLTINTAGLPLSFGDFTANVNMLTLVNEDQDMVLITQGDAEIQLVGNIGFYKSNGGDMPEPADRYFQALEDGQIFIYVPSPDALNAGVDIIGSTTGNTIAPGITGTLLHLTGQLGIPNRTYWDGNGDYVSWVARRWNGNVATPTQVLAGEDVLRINSTAATTSGVGNVAMAQISMMALEDQTPTAQGSSITFTVTPIGSSAASRVAVANVTVAEGITVTKSRVLGNLTVGGNVAVTQLVQARNYQGAVRNLGTVSPGGGDEITIDFATDHIVRCDFSSETIEVGFSNYTAGRTVTLIATNTSGFANRVLDIGIAAANAQGDATLDVNNGTTAIVTYYCTGTTVGDVFASVVFNPN